MVTNETSSEHQVAVLIDFENVGLTAIQWLFDQLSDVGRIIVKRAYADWTSVGNRHRNELLELGIEPIQLFRSGGSGKNASDIRLAIDAVDLVYLSPVDTFVIVSSDSDFVPLVSKLRSAGKSVIGAGLRKMAARSLVISCDRYFQLDEAETLPATAPAQPQRPTDSLLTRAVKAAMDAQGKVIGSKVIQTIQRLDPSFDYRAQGYSTFTRFLEASSDVKVNRRGRQGDVVVELAGTETASEATELDPRIWSPQVDAAWSNRAQRPGESIAGSAAAAAAAVVLGYQKLSVSPYKTLKRLMDASEHLQARWRSDKGKIMRV